MRLEPQRADVHDQRVEAAVLRDHEKARGGSTFFIEMLLQQATEVKRNVKVQDIGALTVALYQLYVPAERLQRLVHADIELVLMCTVKDQHAKALAPKQAEIGHLGLHVLEVDKYVGKWHQRGHQRA